MLTDTAIWKHYFNEKSRVFHKFGSNMKKMQQIMGIIMEMFANEDIVNFCEYSTCFMYSHLFLFIFFNKMEFV